MYKANFGNSGNSGISASLGGRRASVGVAIISHNYGAYLEIAIRSVLEQTLKPLQIVVIDDSSTDDTAEIAAKFAADGVVYVRVETGNVWENRLTAFKSLETDWVLCLDADNYLLPGYLEQALRIGNRRPNCGMVFPDLQRFGDVSEFVRVNDTQSLWQQNFVDAGAVYRREAVLQQDLGHVTCDPASEADDWLLARHIAAGGWTAERNHLPLMYRVHGRNKHFNRTAHHPDYFEDASLRNEPVTIIVLLSGRQNQLDDLTNWLDEQAWPRVLCRLVVVDNSHDPEFGNRVQSWLNSSSYTDYRYRKSSLGENGLADMPRANKRFRSQKINMVVAGHYNQSIKDASSEFVFTIEDDVIPEGADVIEQLMRALSYDTAGVTGAYQHRDSDRWLAWKGTSSDHVYPEGLGRGVEDIDGCGFGCLLLRRSVFQSQKLTSTGHKTIFFDCNACDFVRDAGWKLKINWNVVCDHRAEPLLDYTTC